MAEYQQEVEKKVPKRSQSNEVSLLVQELLNQNLSSNTHHSYQIQTGQHSGNTTFNHPHSLSQTFNKRKESARGSSTNFIDRSLVGKSDKDGILVYCGELNRQIEQKNQELNKAFRDFSTYRVVVEQKIQECARDGTNPLSPIVELLQKEKNDLKSEIIELNASENYLKDEISKLEGQVIQQEKIIREYEILLESKDKTISEIKKNFEQNQQQNGQLNNEIANYQDIYDSKEKLQAQLEHRIYVLEQENSELRERLENTQVEYKGYIGQFEDEKGKIMEECHRYNNLKDVVAETHSVIGKFINDFAQVTKLRNIQSITVPSFHQMITEFNFNVEVEDVQAIDTLYKWITSLFDQVEFQTNMILKLEEEAEANQDRIKDLQQDLYESVNIGKLLKDKESKLLQELESKKQNNENQMDSQRNNQKGQNKVNEAGQTNNQIKNLSEQLIAAQEEVQNLKEEMETSEQLKNAKQYSEKNIKQQSQEIQLENDRIKVQKEVYQNALFKISHILPHIELEEIIKEFIQNSELLYQAQIQSEQEETQFEQNDNDLRKCVKEEQNNTQQALTKRKSVEQAKNNLKETVSQCKKLRERENFLLAEIDKISQFEKQRIEKAILIEREYNKIKSQLQYEQKRTETLMSRQVTFSPNRSNMKTSNLLQQSPNYSDLQSQRNNFMSSSDLELQRFDYPNKENELQRNERLNSEGEQQFSSRDYVQQIYDASCLKNKLLKQQSFQRQISSTLIDVNKDKIISNLLNSNISLRSNFPNVQNSLSANNFNLTSSGKMSSIELQQNMMLSSDKSNFLRMKLEEKLISSKKTLGYSNKKYQ